MICCFSSNINSWQKVVLSNSDLCLTLLLLMHSFSFNNQAPGKQKMTSTISVRVLLKTFCRLVQEHETFSGSCRPIRNSLRTAILLIIAPEVMRSLPISALNVKKDYILLPVSRIFTHLFKQNIFWIFLFVKKLPYMRKVPFMAHTCWQRLIKIFCFNNCNKFLVSSGYFKKISKKSCV